MAATKTELEPIFPAGTAPSAPDVPAALADLSTSELKAALSEALRLTAEHLRRLSWIVRLLEERGEDLSDLRIGLLDYLRKIAHGQVLPELIVRYAESPLALRMVAALPIPDQRRLAVGEPVKLMLARPDGSFDHRLADPLTLGRVQLHQVFGGGRLRDSAEQIGYLEGGAARPAKSAAQTEKVGRITVDRKHGRLRIGRALIEPGLVVEALARLNTTDEDDPTDDPDDGERKTVVVSLSPDQYEAIRIAVARAGVRSPSVLARRALVALGLVPGA